MNQIKLFIILLFLSSCVEVEFKNPMPPKGNVLERIPNKIIAYFINLEKDSVSKINDFEDNFDLNAPLPEKIILKKWKGNYYVNEQSDNGFWQIYIIKPSNNNSYDIYQLDGSNQATIDKLKSITNVEEVIDKNKDIDRIIIDPSFKEFKKIIKVGAFEKIDLFDN